MTALARHTLRTAATPRQPARGDARDAPRCAARQPTGPTCAPLPGHAASRGEHADLTVTLAGHPTRCFIEEGGNDPDRQLRHTVGVLDPISVSEVPARLTPGQTLLLYTDGLPEARRESGAQDGAAWLGDVHGLARQPLADLVEHIEQRALERAQGRLRDDIALLAIRAEGPREASGRP